MSAGKKLTEVVLLTYSTKGFKEAFRIRWLCLRRDMNVLLTVRQVADLLSCKPSSVYAWAKVGKIPAFKLNGCLRFDSREIEEWVQQNRLKPIDIDKQVKRIFNPTREVDINAIVRKSIDSVKGSGYTPH